jgi:hypothetical protein
MLKAARNERRQTGCQSFDRGAQLSITKLLLLSPITRSRLIRNILTELSAVLPENVPLRLRRAGSSMAAVVAG